MLGSGGPREIASLAEYEALVAEGDRARGTLLRTELYCAPLNSIGFRPDEDTPVALLALADEQGRIAGAECRWGREAQSPEFVLIVPPALSEPFAGSPRVEINFVQRRRVHARVEWLGRSEELALRYAGILHAIER